MYRVASVLGGVVVAVVALSMFQTRFAVDFLPSNSGSQTRMADIAPLPFLDREPAVTIATRSVSDPLASPSPTMEIRTALAAAPTQAVHTVKLGESLQTIAYIYYQDTSKADLLFEANRRLLTRSPTPQVGQLLRIPDLSKL